MKKKRMPINRGWKFALNLDETAFAPGYDAGDMAAINLPHDWQIENRRDPDMPQGGSQGFYPREGVGYYRYEFTADKAWAGKRVQVLFDGVQRFSTVYINGQQVGGHMYGYVPFWVDLTDKLNYGETNVLGVMVDNSPDPRGTCAVITDAQAQEDIRDWSKAHGLPEDALIRGYSCGGDRWYSGAGIYRNVWLIVDEKISVNPYGIYVLPNAETGEVKANISLHNDTGSETEIELRWTISNNGGAVISGSEKKALPMGDEAFTFDAVLTKFEKWDTNAPNMYRIDVDVVVGGKVVDSVFARFGFRDARFDADKGFFLNGRQLKLYGADLHHDGGIFGAAMPPKVIKRRLQALKKMGCNAIRCSHNPQNEEFYDLCDDMGLLVIDELYDKWAGTPLYYQRFFIRDHMDDLSRMIARDRNHPSIILWSVGNEVDIQYQESFYVILRGLCEKCRALDPTRPVSAALIGFVLRDFNDRTPLEKRLKACVRYGEIVDVFMGNYMEGFYDALRGAGLHKAFIGSEVFSYYRLKDLETTTTILQSPWNDLNKDYVAGGFVWAGVDYLGESSGWPCHGWTGCPIDSAGFPKLRACHLASQWGSAESKQPFVKIAVFDESEPYDMAITNWGFPQMTDHWNRPRPVQMLHLAVFTNCEKVELYQNDKLPRISCPDANDRMAHFYIDYQPGTLRAVGYCGDKPVCEQTLRTSPRGEKLKIRACEGLVADGADIAHIEVELVDKFGQIYTQDRAQIQFSVEGPADIVGVDNGDFITDTEIFAAEKRTLNHGRALAVIRSREQPGTIRVKAIADGYAPVTVVLESVKCD